MADALIIDAVRSAIGRRNGTLAGRACRRSCSGCAERPRRPDRHRHRRDRGRPDGLRDPGWGAGLQRRPASPSLVAGWPETVAATTVDRQCGSSMQAAFNAVGCDPGGPPRRRRCRGRRVDVARADGLEPRHRRLVEGSTRRSQSAGRSSSGHLGRGDRQGVEHHPRAARRVLARVDHARGRRDRRRQVRAGDRPGRRSPDGGTVRGRRGSAPRHVRRAACRAQACIHRGRST